MNNQKIIPKKHLGQNFLKDEKALKSILKAANISSTDHVIEIGPGLGVLTERLCQLAKRVTALELDKDLISVLSQKLSQHKNFHLIHTDALAFSPPAGPYSVVANIPYYITSPLLNHFLQNKNKPLSMTLLVQKEVAEKICDTKKHSILSLQVALFAEASYIKTVPASSFHPAPKVDSAIIHLTLHEKKSPNFTPDQKAQKILTLAKKAFSQKRKKLKNTIAHEIQNPQIDLNRRPEDLSINEWQKLL